MFCRSKELTQVKNYEELVEKVKEAVSKAQPGQWILGWGWHQDKWDKKPEKLIKGFQTHALLSSVSPQNPVFLWHASGHAAFTNAMAMKIAGVNLLSVEKLTRDLGEGGEIIRDELGNPTGIFRIYTSSCGQMRKGRRKTKRRSHAASNLFPFDRRGALLFVRSD